MLPAGCDMRRASGGHLPGQATATGNHSIVTLCVCLCACAVFSDETPSAWLGIASVEVGKGERVTATSCRDFLLGRGWRGKAHHSPRLALLDMFATRFPDSAAPTTRRPVADDLERASESSLAGEIALGKEVEWVADDAQPCTEVMSASFIWGRGQRKFYD